MLLHLSRPLLSHLLSTVPATCQVFNEQELLSLLFIFFTQRCDGSRYIFTNWVTVHPNCNLLSLSPAIPSKRRSSPGQWFHSQLPLHIFLFCCCCLVAKHGQLFCDTMDCSLPGSSVHGISQVRILESVAISFSKGSS